MSSCAKSHQDPCLSNVLWFLLDDLWFLFDDLLRLCCAASFLPLWCAVLFRVMSFVVWHHLCGLRCPPQSP